METKEGVSQVLLRDCQLRDGDFADTKIDVAGGCVPSSIHPPTTGSER
jgi:hypothetical protein